MLFGSSSRRLRGVVLLLLLAVALPSLLLTGFGLLAISNERDAARQRLEDLYQPLVRSLAGKLAAELAATVEASAAPLAALVRWARYEIAAPDATWTSFLRSHPAVARPFVFDAEGRALAPRAGHAMSGPVTAPPPGYDHALGRQLREVEARLAGAPVEAVDAATVLATMVHDPTRPASSSQRHFVARRARGLLETAAVPGGAASLARLGAIRSDSHWWVRRLRHLAGRAPSLHALHLGIQHVLMVGMADGELAGFEVAPAVLEIRLRALAQGLGVAAELEPRLEYYGKKRHPHDRPPPMPPALAVAAPLAGLPGWQVTLGLPAGTGLETLTESRTTLYVWILVLLVGILVAGIGRTVQVMVREDRLARMKTDFVSSVSHELRTPLTSIRLFTETLLLGRARDKDHERECLETVGRESERLSRLVERILDFSRLDAGRKEYRLASVDLRAVIADAVAACAPQAEEHGFTLTQDLPADLPPVPGDRDALVEAVLNLLSNALKFSGAAREVALTVRMESEHVVIRVRDHGLGIPRGDQAKIFEPFHRVDEPATAGVAGSGLGLSLVRHIAAAHGGEVTVDSVPGRGSTFTLRLPRQREERDA